MLFTYKNFTKFNKIYTNKKNLNENNNKYLIINKNEPKRK